MTVTDPTPRAPSSRWRGVVRAAGTWGRRDPLTGLGTRERLTRRGPLLLEASAKQGRQAALLLLDIDGFKLLNDTVGHHAGDKVLVAVARRLETVARAGDLVVRLGGDEFALLAGGLGADEAEQRAQAVVDALAEPIGMDDLLLSQRASVGLAVHDHDGETIDQLLRAADQAMYDAKAHRPGGWQAASAVADRRPGHSARMVAALRADPHGDRVVVHYQPQIDTRSAAITGFEALARWHHPDLGLLPPRSFIPLAERSGLMPPITAAVLDRALGDLPALSDAAPGCTVSINITRRHLLVRGLVDDLNRRLGALGLGPDRVVLEVPESVARVTAATLSLFDDLHARGFRVSVRGFGGTDTSLTALWTNPAVTEIKLHRGLVARLALEPRAERLARAVTGAAHDLGLRVVAVGVETAALHHRLADLGCDEVQGFLVAPPDPVEATVAWARHWPETRAATLQR